MKRLFNFIFTALFLLVNVGLTRAQNANNGFAFLKLPVDARSAALGESGTAYGADAGAMFFNPANLTMTRGNNLLFMHNAYLADITQEFAAFQFMSGKHNLALSLNMMTIPGIEIRGDRPTEQPAGTTEAVNFAFSIAYAQKLSNAWAVGINLKYLFEKYYLNDASGFAVDLGISRQNLFNKGIVWGMSVQNLGKMQKLRMEATPLPTLLRTGVALSLPIFASMQPIFLSSDVVYYFSEGARWTFGAEVPFNHVLTFRSGMILGGEKWRYTLGLGVSYGSYQINYAYAPFPFNLGNSHRFSLSWWF